MRSTITIGLLAAFAISAASSSAAPGPLTFTADDLGGGVFQYHLTLENPFGVPISGLNLFRANTVFGLDESGVIGAPEDIGGNPMFDWSFFAPIPGLVDELNYFALDPGADIAPGGSLSGFFFQAPTDPGTLPPDGLVLARDYDLIDSSGRQIIPESERADVVLIIGFGAAVAYGLRCRSLRRSAPTGGYAAGAELVSGARRHRSF